MKLMYKEIFGKDNLENVANNRKFSLSLIIIFSKKIGWKIGKKEGRKKEKREEDNTAQ